MAGALTVAVGTRHGETCTCKPLDEITQTVTVQPVIVDRDCPGQRDIPRTDQIQGRVIITWPARKGHAPLAAWGVSIQDADSGEQWTADVLNLRVSVDPRGITTATLERMVDADGKPIGRGKAVPAEDGSRYRTALFRYAVAEMRIADPA